MTISAISGASQFTPMQQNQRQGGRLDEQLNTLKEAIAAGDLDAVQSAYDDITSQLPEGAGGDGKDPVGQFLSAVSEALASNDVSALESAAETFSTFTPPSGAGNGNMPPPPPPPADSATSDSISSLLTALEDDDASAAQTSYDALIAALSANDSMNSADSYENPLQTALEQVGDALESGDTELAQSYLETLMQQLPPGSLLSENA